MSSVLPGQPSPETQVRTIHGQIFQRRTFQECCEAGFWFCTRCQKVTEPDDRADWGQKCILCGAFKLKWCPPVQSASELRTDEKQGTANRVGTDGLQHADPLPV